MYVLEDNLGPDNRENAAGVEMILSISHVGNFATIAGFDTYSAAGDYVKISSDHAFDGTDGFTKLRFIPDSPKVTATGPEARDASGYNGTMEGMIVGTDEEITAEVIHKLATGDIICLAKTANGKQLQLGNAGFPAQLRLTEDTTGTTVEGQNAQSVRIIFNQQRKQFYSGTITYKS